ncbi:MAG: membrane protein insertase YidC [Lentisphaeria bacterium]|nr:membrane protein insertase YidC [Lentisphaeria bacterium]
MKFDKETVIVLGTCMILMLAWPSISEFMGWSKPRSKPVPAQVQTAPAQTPAAPVQAQTAPVQIPAVPHAAANVPANCTLTGDDLILEVSGATGAVDSLTFRKYLNSDQTAPIRIAAGDAAGALFRYFIPDVATGALPDGELLRSGDSVTSARLLTIPQGRFKLVQTVTLDANYVLRCRCTFTAAGTVPVVVPPAVISGGAMGTWHELSGDKIRTVSHRLDYLTASGDFDDVKADADAEKFFLNPAPRVRWAGVSNKYFCILLKSGTPFTLWQGRRFADGDRKRPEIAAGMKLPAMTLLPGVPQTLEVSVYAGPKVMSNLAAFAPDAEKVMHLAWGPLNYLARFLLWVLNALQQLCGSYGLSIIILTLLVRTVFYPLTARGNESMKKMQKVQPQFKELREKYKDNPQLLNQKMAELYRKEGVNPFAGCLPILLQIPIFFALYAMLDNVIGLRHVSFLWCRNLAAADTVCRIPLFVNLPWIGSGIPVNPLVLVMTALMVVQQRMTPMAADPMQKKMMAMMPVIMLVFLYDLPSGLTLYWTVSNIFSIVQLWLQKRRGRAPVAARSN